MPHAERSSSHKPIGSPERDCRKFWGHAATATDGCEPLAGRNLCPKLEPRVPL